VNPKKMEEISMNKCQKIQCSVSSCMFNEFSENLCNLDAIQVSAGANSDSGAPYDETLCASYKPKKNKK
jgi:hypothetical protein